MYSPHPYMARHTAPSTHTNMAQRPHCPPLSGWSSNRENGTRGQSGSFQQLTGLKHRLCHSFHTCSPVTALGQPWTRETLCSLGHPNLCSCLPLCLCAPPGLWRQIGLWWLPWWAWEYPGRAGYYLGFHSFHSLSESLFACADEFFRT